MKIFIDGAAGSTGLALEEKLSGYISVRGTDIEMLKPDERLRKDPGSRKEFLNRADVVFLCLPDEAAQEAAKMVENPETVIIDASTAHRTAPGWAYGFPELSEKHREAVKTSDRISVPGCHASGFSAIVFPLVKNGFIDKNATVFCHSMTGYSGGGKKMVDEYESDTGPCAAKLYSLGLNHKHLPEMQYICGLKSPPVFTPIVINVRQGMVVSVPLILNAGSVWKFLNEYYTKAAKICVMPFGGRESLEIDGVNGTDYMEIFVFGNDRQTVVSARFDNLGKGSSGAALQCMELRMKTKLESK
jgi:N-acetyl-gamma-glutamyl-phosphate reductase